MSGKACGPLIPTDTEDPCRGRRGPGSAVRRNSPYLVGLKVIVLNSPCCRAGEA
jgi:hypothetical protein